MTAKAPTPIPEGMTRENRPRAPSAPPKSNRLTVDEAFDIVLNRYEKALEELAKK